MVRQGKNILLPLLFGLLCFVNVIFISVDISATETKSGVRYQSKVTMEANTSKSIYLAGSSAASSDSGKATLFRVDKLSSNSTNLKVGKAREKEYLSWTTARLYAKKEGNYTITITLKIKGKAKSEKIKVAVEVSDKAPIKGITMDGKKMEKEEGEGQVYFSPKSSGKLKVITEKGYEVTKIYVHGDDKWQVPDGVTSRPSHYYFGAKRQSLKNGEKVQLNNKANGSTCEIDAREDGKSVDGEFYPFNYLLEETFDFTMAMSKITIYCQENGGTGYDDLSIDITVYTPVGK